MQVEIYWFVETTATEILRFAQMPRIAG